MQFVIFPNSYSDLAVFVNSNMLITKIIVENAQWLCVSSTSASKFEFLDLPIGTGSTGTQFEFKFAGDTNLQIYISRSHIYSGRTLEFISAQHKLIITRGFSFKLCANRAYRELEKFKL